MSEIEDRFLTLPASIGSASFQMHASKQDMGRRRALQELPDTDFVIEQDLGPQADDFTISGHIADPGYLDKKKALQDVFRTEGPKLLVHPFEGRFLVKIEGRLSIDEDISKLGWAEISFRCKRATRDDINRTTVDPRDTATSAATAARETVAATGAANVAQLSVTSVRTAFREKIVAVQKILRSSIGNVLDVTDSAGAAIASSVYSLTTVTDGLLTSPLDLFTSIAATTRAVIKAPFVVQTTAEQVYGALSDGDRVAKMLGIAGRFVRIDENDLDPLSPACLQDGPSADDETDDATTRNSQTITACLRTEAVAAMLEALLDVPPDSTSQADDAIRMMTQLLTGEVDGDPDALLYAVDGDSMAALANLRNAFAAYIASLTSLPTVNTFTVPADTNAIMLAQLLLGDGSRFDEIVSRNHLDDPMSVPAGTEIEYLRAA